MLSHTRRKERTEPHRRCKDMEREQITIRLPAELKERIQQEADRKGISFNQFLLLLLREYVNAQK